MIYFLKNKSYNINKEEIKMNTILKVIEIIVIFILSSIWLSTIISIGVSAGLKSYFRNLKK